jgi:hypothetical protein
MLNCLTAISAEVIFCISFVSTIRAKHNTLIIPNYDFIL